jgi:hypothetical protein
VLLVYKPEGADKRTWSFAPDKIMSSEAEAVEKVTGMTYEEFGLALLKGSATARRALLWVYLKREDPTLRHNQVDPPVGTVGIDYEPHELKAIREQLEKDTTLSDADRDAALRQFDELIGDDDTEGPKAPGNDDASSDSDSSPTSSTSPQLRSAG